MYPSFQLSPNEFSVQVYSREGYRHTKRNFGKYQPSQRCQHDCVASGNLCSDLVYYSNTLHICKQKLLLEEASFVLLIGYLVFDLSQEASQSSQLFLNVTSD